MIENQTKNDVRNLGSRNIHIILDALKIDYVSRDNLIQGCCPCKQHGGDGDNTKAFSWRHDIGHWVCWTHHCEETHGGDVYGLVRSCLNCSFEKSILFVQETLKNSNGLNFDLIPQPKESPINIHSPIDEGRLRFLQKDFKYLIQRGFDPKVLNEYEVGFWYRPGTFMHDRIIFPIRDHNNYLVGFSGRTIHNKEYFEKLDIDFDKWKHGRYYDRYPKNDKLFTGSLLFNFNKAKLRTQFCKRIILVEGPLDGIKLEMCGIKNWVATFGTKFSVQQKSILVKAGITDLFVAYDNDENNAGEEGFERVQKIIGDLMNVHRVPLKENDPGDMSIQDIKQLFGSISC